MKEKKTGILLMNLGSPDSTATKDVRKYLNEFLMDERVIDIAYLKRLILVKGIIVPFRAPKSAEAYKTIWTDAGSPLVVMTGKLQEAVQQRFAEPVEIAMRYGNPSAKAGLDTLQNREPALEEVIAVPLYPHYAMSSFETAVEAVKETHAKYNYPFSVKFVAPYFDDVGYIDALAETMRPYLSKTYDKILFSYHGVPARHIRKSDVTGCHCLNVENCCAVSSPAHAKCYRHQCLQTTRLVTEKLNIPETKYNVSFQSRLGKGWLEPFTDKRLAELPGEGVKKLLILCPAFVSDCLETLEEIEMRGKEIFMEAGGEEYQMIPCLNTSPLWVDALENLIRKA